MLVIGLIWRSLPRETPEGQPPHVPLLRLALLGVGVLCVVGSGQVASMGLRLALIVSAGVWVVMALFFDAHAAHRLFPSQPLALTDPGRDWLLDRVSLWRNPRARLTSIYRWWCKSCMASRRWGPGTSAYCGGCHGRLAHCARLGLQGQRVRLRNAARAAGGDSGVVGQATVVGDGPLFLLGSFAVLTGIGYGLCYAHFNSWTIAAARPGEEDRTASFIPLGSQLGTALGAAIAGVVANAAGLAAGVSVTTVTAAATWVYGLSVVAPATITVLTLRVLWWHQPVWPPFGQVSPKAANRAKGGRGGVSRATHGRLVPGRRTRIFSSPGRGVRALEVPPKNCENRRKAAYPPG